jgi:hypothetical protein
MTRAMVTLFTAKPQRAAVRRLPTAPSPLRTARLGLLAAISRLH